MFTESARLTTAAWPVRGVGPTGIAGPDLVLSLVERLWSAESRDERALGLEILYLHPKIGSALGRDRFDRWRLDIDNWGVCDFLATRILGPWADTDPEGRLSYLEDLVGDPHLYSRRLGIVASVHLNRARLDVRRVDSRTTRSCAGRTGPDDHQGRFMGPAPDDEAPGV